MNKAWLRVLLFVAVVAFGTYRYGPSPFWIPVAFGAVLHAVASALVPVGWRRWRAPIWGFLLAGSLILGELLWGRS